MGNGHHNNNMKIITPLSLYRQMGYLSLSLNIDNQLSKEMAELPHTAQLAAYRITPVAEATLPRSLTNQAKSVVKNDLSAMINPLPRGVEIDEIERCIEGALSDLGVPGVSLEHWLATHQLDSPAEEAFVKDVYYPVYGDVGLSHLDAQVQFMSENGRRGRSDFVVQVPDGEIAIEIDGHTYHAEGVVDRARFDQLTERNNAQSQCYQHVIRLTADHCLTDPERGQRELKSVLGELSPASSELKALRSPVHPLLSAWPVSFSAGQLLGLSQMAENSVIKARLTGFHPWAIALGWIDALLSESSLASLEGQPTCWREVELHIDHKVEENFTLIHSELKRLGFKQMSEEAAGEVWRYHKSKDHEQSISMYLMTAQDDIAEDLTELEFSVGSVVRSGNEHGRRVKRVGLSVQWLKSHRHSPQWSYSLCDMLSCAGVALDLRSESQTRLCLNADRQSLPTLKCVAPKEEDVLFFFERYFGYREFREGQWQIISRLLTGQSTLGVLPTGAGKSVCFQLPSLLIGQTTLVVSPLISLIKDQVSTLEELSIPGVFATSSGQSLDEKKYMDCQLSVGACVMLYVSPERLQIKRFIDGLRSMVSSGSLSFSLSVLDEAHIASEWGHGFRPSYLSTPRRFRELAPSSPIALLTATASAPLRRDLLRLFSMRGECEVRPKSFQRDELSFDVLKVETEEDRLAAIENALREQLPRIFSKEWDEDFREDLSLWESVSRLNGRERHISGSSYLQGGLIFTPWAKRAKEGSEHKDRSLRVYALRDNLRDMLKSEVSAELVQREPQVMDEIHRAVAAYSSSGDRGSSRSEGADVHQKHTDQDYFMNNRAAIMVATKGFGMGIDKPNLRYVIHTNLAGSIESYYQEVGRAGRDRESAIGILLHTPRHSRCSIEYSRGAPPCVDQQASKGKNNCPYDLPERCGYGLQAFMMSNEAKPVLVVQEDVAQLFEQLWANGRAQIIEGGELRLPLKVMKRGLKRQPLFDSLSHLSSLNIVQRYNENNRQQVFVNLRPMSLDSIRSEFNQRWPQYRELWGDVKDLGLLIEKGLRSGLGLSLKDAERGASLWQTELSRKRDSGETRRLDLYQGELSSRDQRRGIELEHLLYRLSKIGVVTDYLQSYQSPSKAEWVVSLQPFDERELWRSLEAHLRELIPLRGRELKAKLEQKLELARGEASDRTEELKSEPRARAKACILTALNQMIIITDEVLVTQRWQMLNNHERYAQEQDCRTKLMLDMLGVDESLSGSCGRCDRCGIQPLSTLREAKRKRAQALEDKKERQREEEKKRKERQWRAELDLLLDLGFGDQEAVSVTALSSLVNHIDMAPLLTAEQSLEETSRFAWKTLEGRLRGKLEASPEDLFLNAALSITTLKLNQSIEQQHAAGLNLLDKISRTFSDSAMRCSVLRALPLELLFQLFENHGAELAKKVEVKERLALGVEVYGALSLSQKYDEAERARFSEIAERALALTLSLKLKNGGTL